MKNLVITVQNFEGKGTSIYGVNYRAITAELDGRKIHGSTAGYAVADFTEEAIQKVIHSEVRNGFTPIELTVNVPLSEGAKTQIADRYAGDPMITSITFE